MDGLLSALRRIRGLTAEDPDALAVAVLDVVRDELRASSATLVRRGLADVTVGVSGAGGRTLEVAASTAEAVATLVLTRAEGFDAADASRAEVLADVALSRVALARAERETARAMRQLALLDSLTRAGGETVDVATTAERAVHELRDAFAEMSLALHVVRGDRLELVARHASSGESRFDAAPEWLRSFALDSRWMQPRAAREKRTLALPVEAVTPEARATLEAAGVKHVVAAPLMIGDRVVGTLSITHANAHAWDDAQIRLVEGLATRLATELSHMSRLDDERRRSRDLALLNEIGGLVAQELDVDAVLGTAVRELARVADVPRATLLLLGEDGTTLTQAAGFPGLAKPVVIPVDGPGLAALVVRTGVPAMVEDTAGDPRVHQDMVQTFGVRSVLAVPMISKGAPIGAIVLAETRRARRFTEEEVARATAVANLVAPAIANAKMFADLRRSYEALGRAQADLVTHERLAALGELSAVIAHEVRNPLAILFNSLGSLRKLAPPGPDALLLLDIMGEEAARLNRIVGDLLDFVRPYASHPRPAQLDALVRSAIDGARRAVPGSAASVTTELAVGTGELVLDGTMIQQALINLIVNALQASGRAGTVSVRVRGTDEAAGRPELHFEVADDGPGIAPAEAAKIFQPFFTTKATGTGLGLAVVRRIADALDGSVAVAPGAERGSVFTLRIPVAGVVESEPAHGATAPA